VDGKTFLAVCGNLLVTFWDIQGILLEFHNHEAAVNGLILHSTAMSEGNSADEANTWTLISYLLELNIVLPG
jgi:hypothetical protein